MADRRKDSTVLVEQDKILVHKDFLEKFQVRRQMKDALLKLIENRPEEPLLFLSNYFDSISSENKADKISNAARTLALSHHSSPAFQNNLVLAYDILSAPKNPNSKKLANKRLGMTGSVHEELLGHLCSEIPKELCEALIDKVSCKWNEMVPFEVFKYSITVAYVLKDFLELSEDLFQVLSGKNDTADRYLCDVALTTFREALAENEFADSLPVMEAGRKLRPDNLAYAMLQAKEDEGDAENSIEMNEFILAIANVYLDNVKNLR